MYWHPRYILNWDWWLVLFTLLMVGCGLIILSSAIMGFDPDNARGYLTRQAAALVIGIFIWMALGLVDYGDFGDMTRVLYGLNLFILLLVLFFGVEHNGSKSWLDLKLFQVQPSELSKVLLILTLAKLLSSMERLKTWLDLSLPIIHVLPILVLILLEGDLGTAMVVGAICIVLVYCAGFPGRKILTVAIVGAVLVTGIVVSHYRFQTKFPLANYQWQRIHIFLYPESDPAGHGYQVTQSKVAIGSGGMRGRGFGKGTQNRLGYLPYQHTDFVFAVLAEEWGFVGSAAVMGLYGLILFRIGSISQQSRDTYGSLIAVGVAALLGAHVLENIGMTMGVTPVTGIPLPFISYGPTNLLANLVALGLVLNVAVQRDPLKH